MPGKRVPACVPTFSLRVLPTRPLRLTSRQMKIPLMVFYGAFGLTPYCRKMKVVIGRWVWVN